MSPRSRLTSFGASRWVRRLFWAVASLLVLWALAWLVVPPLAKSQLVKAASEQLGRTLTVGEIDFKPWTLELTLRDLAVATRDATGTQFGFKRLYVNAELESLLRLAPVVDALVLEGPQVKLRRVGDGAYDVDDLLQRFAAKPAAAAGDDPVRFALFNLSVRDGSVHFDDGPAGKSHQLSGLMLSVPFLSNLDSRREVTVTPRLAFNLNGSRFDASASATPFAPSRKTDATLQVRAMDLTPYLPYIPRSVPVRLQQAVLDADIRLRFAQLPAARVVLDGQIALKGVQLADPAGKDLLALDGLKVVFDSIRPLEQVVEIGAVELDGPRLNATRDGAGRINLDLAAQAGTGPAPTPAAEAGAAGAAGPWKLSVARLALRDGAARWTDASVSPPAQLQLSGLALQASDLVWPMERPLAFNGSFAVSGPGPAERTGAGTTAAAAPAPATGAAADARLVFSGNATDKEATLKLALSNADLGLAAPYLAGLLEPVVRGRLHAEVGLNWKAPDLRLAVTTLTLDDLALAQAGAVRKADLASVKRVAVSAASVDLGRRQLAAGSVVVTQPETTLARGADGHWMFERWLKPAPAAAGMAPAAAKAAKAADTAAAASAWQGRIDELQLRGGAIRFEDKAAANPVAFDVSALNLELKGATLDGKQPVPVHLSASIAARPGKPGKLDYRGTVQGLPLRAKGRIDAAQIPLHVFEPYFGAGLNIEIVRADAGFKGEFDFAAGAQGPVVTVRGDTVLEDFRANSIAARGGEQQLAQELLNWKALGLRGVELALAPGTAPRVAVRETTLSDFFARVIVHESGRINLQDLVRSDAAAQSAQTGSAAGAPAVAAGAVPAPAPVAAAADPLAPVIAIGPISLVHGKVLFSDRFVKPNYSADLSELTGKLSAFSSVPVQGQPLLADLELRGRAEGTASLEILGQLNPLAKPLALDIKGKVRDLELPPLSPYSVKYAGYGIERGKLSVDVSYLVQPDGQLTASNKVVLNQLAFGDKVEGAPNSLPVKLAVALLADRNGVIDIDLPISGSLNDPQFRLGPVIFKVIVNLIGKALTAPFSLLASAFGGGDELSSVAFAPGSSVLLPPAQAGLDKVVKALTDRPMLKMTVVGSASLEAEREAFKRARLQELLQAEKRRALVSAGTVPVAPDASAPVPLDEAEVPGLLAQVFRRSEIAKPRDLAGVAMELAPAEMEALLLANIPATEDAMRELAVQRGIAVKDYLAARQLPTERLFLGAVKLAEGDPKWSPRAELSLATR